MRCDELESERNALQDALADALNQLQETQASNAELVSLRKQNKQLEEDVLLLKSTVYRFVQLISSCFKRYDSSQSCCLLKLA